MNSRDGDYRAQLRRATPGWYKVGDFEKAKRRARFISTMTGKLHVVDHIVPLANPLVCGLHCAANFQVLPAELNQEKLNTWWPDAPFAQLHLFHGEHSDSQMALPLLRKG